MMATRCGVLDRRFTFEYDVGLWTFGSVQVIKERASGALRFCKAVPKVSLRGQPAETVARLKKLQGLRQKHICPVVEVLEDASNILIISEKTAGGDVGEWTARVMEEGNWLQERTVAEYIRQTLIALARAHAEGFRHGDLRPSSLALTSKLPDAGVLLCDLGLADALDPDGSSTCWNANPYTAPELLPEDGAGAGYADPAADLWSLGAVAHALLVGYAPCQEAPSWRGRGSYIEPRREGSSWAERTALSYDFVRGLLKQAESRPTAAEALQHPWLRGFSEVQSARSGVGGEAQHALLSYMLAVLLLPECMKPRDLRQLMGLFDRLDSDCDGFISSHSLPRLLENFGVENSVAAAAAETVDVHGTESLDVLAVACACLVARTAAPAPASPPQGIRGQHGSPRSNADVARRLLKRFFQTYADAERPNEVPASHLRSCFRGSAGKELEAKAGVRYSELLASLPDTLDAATLAQELVSAGGRGTPLAPSEEPVEVEMEPCWVDAFGLGHLADLLGALLRSCGVGPGGHGGHGGRRKMIQA